MKCNDSPLTASLNRSISPELGVCTLKRTDCEEFFITAVLMPGETTREMFSRVAEVIRQKNASIVCQDIFGVLGQDGAGLRLLGELFGNINWPITWIEDGPGDDLAGTFVWAVCGPSVSSVEMDGRVVGNAFDDGYVQYLRLGEIRPDNIDQSRTQQAEHVFGMMKKGLALAEMNFSNVLRTWFYNDDILSWYDGFNRVRDGFFTENGVFEGMVPASTGIGGQNTAKAALVGGLLAIKSGNEAVKAFAVPSPLQCPALKYGSSFSRAVELALPDHRRLFVSGTASIAPEGHTVFVDDVDAQIEQTMQVVEAILESRKMSWNDVVRGLAYVRNHDDAPAYIKYCKSRGIENIPTILINNVVCRDDLLFEIEVDAINLNPPENNNTIA